MTAKTSLRWFALMLCALWLAACAAPQSSRPAPKPTAGDPFSGRWKGSWRSERTGHSGTLECDFSKVDRTHYRADFRASWSVLSGRYSVLFDARRAGRTLFIKGQHDLGKLYGGVYRNEGKVTPDRFHSRFTAAEDHGVFEMDRVKP